MQCASHAAAAPSAVLAYISGGPRLRQVERNIAHCFPALHLLCPFAWHPGTGGAAESLIYFCDPIVNHGQHLGRKRLMRPDEIKIDISTGLPRNTGHSVCCYVCLVGRKFSRFDDRLHGPEENSLANKGLVPSLIGGEALGYFSFIECIKDRKFFWFPQLTE